MRAPGSYSAAAAGHYVGRVAAAHGDFRGGGGRSVRSVQGCGSFAKGVAGFGPQVQQLPVGALHRVFIPRGGRVLNQEDELSRAARHGEASSFVVLTHFGFVIDMNREETGTRKNLVNYQTDLPQAQQKKLWACGGGDSGITQSAWPP